jgi:hypothetical protein
MFPANEPEPLIGLGLNQPAPSQPEIPTADSLQFHTAIPDDASVRRCTLCTEAIPGEYFQVAGATACPHCAQARLDLQQRHGGWPEFGRAALFGLGAAIAGFVLTGVVGIWLRLGILAIAVGWMVGKAILKGSGGCRGRRYQVLALLLTYGGAVGGYVPQVLLGFRSAAVKMEAKQKAASQTIVAPQKQKVTPIQFAVGIVAIAIFAMAAPVFLLFQGYFMGIIIMVFGLMQAWRLTAADDTAIMGPYAA